jgi:Flp pilus assembly protein TadD
VSFDDTSGTASLEEYVRGFQMPVSGPVDSIAVLFQQATAYYNAGQFVEAELLLHRGLATAPGHSDSLHLLGIIAHQRGNQDLAAELIAQAIKLRSSVPFYHGSLGIVLRAQGQLESAAKCFRKAVQLKPDYVDMRCGLADTLCALGQNDEAVQQYRKVLLQRPDDSGVLENLAIALNNLGRLEEASSAFEHAARLRPDRAELAYWSGAVRMSLGHRTEAEALFRRAIAMQPDYPTAHMSLAAELLVTERFAEGWQELEWRWRQPSQPAPSFAQPRWTGGDLAGRILLLYAEQGFGDTLQFCRYASLFEKDASVVLRVPRPLIRLLGSLPGNRQLVAEDEELPPFDVQCPLLSLPAAFHTALDTIPAQIPYLRAPATAAAHWRDRLSGLPRPWIGLVWSGNPQFPQDAERSLSFGRMKPLLRIPGVTFISLQKGHTGIKPHDATGRLLHDWTDELADFADTAGLIEALDLVISADTAVAHLTGALGRPVWLMNRFNPDWRWLLNRDDSPWYPTLRQFRQKRPYDWDSVIRDVTAALPTLQWSPAG